MGIRKLLDDITDRFFLFPDSLIRSRILSKKVSNCIRERLTLFLSGFQYRSSPIIHVATSAAGSAASMPNTLQKQVSSGSWHARATIVPWSLLAA